jgi:hypothetical protein
MAVSMGLVYDAMSNRTLLAEICCRTSFGLVFRMPNDNSLMSRLISKLRGFKPWGSRRSRDPLTSGVDWFIKQVSLLHRTPCLKRARLLIRFQGDRSVNGHKATYAYKASFKTNAPRVCDVEVVASPNKSLSPSEKGMPPTQSHPDTVYIKLTDLKITRKVVS